MFYEIQNAMLEMINELKDEIPEAPGIYVAMIIVFFECFWSLLYTIKSFWTWGYFLEELGLIATAGVMGVCLFVCASAFIRFCFKPGNK